MNEDSALQKAALQERPPGTGHTVVPSRQPYLTVPFASRRVCFYKSGDTQFSGLPVIINNRTFKTFEALLDSLSKRVPLPFGVRTITTPRGHTPVRSLDQLHHGHSYICSDKRTVKPIDLEQARRKPPPWYHARPVSNRRQKEKQNPGPRKTKRNENAALLHTPKRLVVFRNGDPEIKHTLLLQKKTTHSFEALLDRIAEVMCFPVRRLHTPDGRRVDGLPALIMCSGVLVAAGREPFRKRNYDVQKPFTPTWLPAKSVGRLHPVTRKKKSTTSSTKSRPFSPSSEHYLVNQLHNSFAESANYPTGSVELENAGTDTITCPDSDNNEYVLVPSDDDIEKTFRVNQDGSMTVEMRVRLTIKEEETVHWTTTLSRQSAARQTKSGLDSHSDLSAALSDRLAPDVGTGASAIQRFPEEYSDASSNECVRTLYEDMVNGSEEGIKIKDPLQPLSEEIYCETEGQDTVHSLDPPRDEQEYRLVRHGNECPVPKPRRTCLSQMQANMYKTAEILQLHDSGKETVFHIYEQQTCQKSFLANTEIYAHEKHKCDTVLSACHNVNPSSCKESQPRPVTAHGSLQSLDHFLTPLELQPLSKRKNTPKIENKPSDLHTPINEADNVVSPAATSKKRKKIRVSVKKSHSSHIFTHANKRKESKTDILKEIKKIRTAVVNQVEVIRGMTEQCRAKPVKKSVKAKRSNLSISHTYQMQRQTVSEHFAKSNKKHGKRSERTSPKKHFLDVSTSKCTLTRQTSMQEQQDIASLPALHYSSSVLNKYVEHWLQTSEAETAPDQDLVSPSMSLQELEITCTGLASKNVLTPPLDSTPRNRPNLSKHVIVNSSPKRNTLSRGSAQDSSFLYQMNTIKGDPKLGESNNLVSMPLPASVSLKNTPVGTLEGTSSMIQLPQYVKKGQNTREPLNNASGFACHYVKPTSLSRDSSSEKTLTSQHSIEQIPKNNTFSKASLFSIQGVEKTTLSNNATFHHKPKHLGIMSQESTSPLSGKETAAFPIEKSYTVKMAVRPDMRHVLDELCRSINSLREATKHKQRSCLEKSNSMPDFSSHLATTFGSSSRVLLAFLSVMTLRDGLENLNVLRQTETSLSCSEALLMLHSLKKVAAIEDEEKLRANLNALQKSASDRLLQSWKGFQRMSSTSMSSSITPEGTREGSNSEEEAIQRLMEKLGVPERVRDELAALSVQEKESVGGNELYRSGELYEVKRSAESDSSKETLKFADCVFEDINTYVKFIIEKADYEHRHSGAIIQNSSHGSKKVVVTNEKERKSCPIDGILWDDCILDSAMCKNILEAKQQILEKNDIRAEEKQETYAREEINLAEIKDSPVCGQHGEKPGRVISKGESVAEEYIMDPKYSQPLDNNKEVEEVKGLRDPYKINNGQMYQVESSRCNEGLEGSEEDKSSLEDNTSDEEHIKFFSDKDLASGKQKYSTVEPDAKRQSDEPSSQTVDGAKKNPGQPKAQTTFLAVCLEHEPRHQPMKIYSEGQLEVVEALECSTVHNRREWSIEEAAATTVKVNKKTSSVAELVSNLETCTQRPEKSSHRFASQNEGSDADNLNNVSLNGKLMDTASNAQSSSLSFSYDSRSSSLAQDSERSIPANRVKFIRDMFLAKSENRALNGQRKLHSRNSDLSDSQPESTDTGGTWSQEASSGEDDESRLAIAKGFVRRTIERLYGTGNSSSVDKINSLSDPKAMQRVGPRRPNVSRRTSDHETHNRVTTDVSYFSATNASDLLKSLTACVTLSEQVRPGDANRIDKEHWVFAENHAFEPLPELQNSKNSKNLIVEQEQQSGQGDTSGTPPGTKLDKRPKSSGSKFTYFNLPNASDSELEADEKVEVKVTPETQGYKAIAERTSFLPAFSPPVLKKADNKVHPLEETAKPAVVTQPIKGQRVQTGLTKHSAEPDSLEMLYLFCGQHCPIL